MPRQQERVQYFVEVLVESASGKRQERLSDLSLGGCFVDSIVAMGEGEPVTFQLVREGGESLAFSGRVTYTLPGVGYGVRFVDLAEDQLAFLEQAIGAMNAV